jgi:NADP-dependent 3-hydroxy acid dehydrogenase YdfG
LVNGYDNIVVVVVVIVYSSSVVGHVVPKAGGAHFYSATKFAATAVAEGIRQELREAKSNIRLTVCINQNN